MKKAGLIFFLISSCLFSHAQISFKTLVTNGPVVEGESFIVQYILETTDYATTEFFPPAFKDFRLVSGPTVHEGTSYGGGGKTQVKNVVFSLEPLRPGRFSIPIAQAKVNDEFVKSNSVQVQVISRDEAAKKRQAMQQMQGGSEYFLKPGDDPYQKIRDNLFMKVMVDRKSCFVGEPITATFKLYSRMVSQSDIVKNPGFYGFTVMDVIGLNDKQIDAEIINGKKFDVHTVRKVQLYPLRAGSFTIDPMEVENSVEFSRSIVNKKSEQKIVEGVLPPDNTPDATNNTETYKSNMSSPAVKITVKPSPEKNQPAEYSGATGHFSLTTSVNKNSLDKNEEGQLTVTLTGKGNFTQLSAPVIHWPDSLEGFDPKITDELDIHVAPVKGTRTFHYLFVSATAGGYVIPAISFSFFDPDSATYKTITTKPITITINNKEAGRHNLQKAENATTSGSNHIMSWSLAIALLLIAAGTLLVINRKKKKAVIKQPVIEESPTRPSLITIMTPAELVIKDSDNIFYTTCQQCIWKFFTLYFGLTGSGMNARNLVAVMRQQQVDEKNQKEIVELLQECETGIFAGATMDTDRHVLLKKINGSLNEIAVYVKS
ncbi:MAG: BatD family protein [Chitinophagaceae bacterium]